MKRESRIVPTLLIAVTVALLLAAEPASAQLLYKSFASGNHANAGGCNTTYCGFVDITQDDTQTVMYYDLYWASGNFLYELSGYGNIPNSAAVFTNNSLTINLDVNAAGLYNQVCAVDLTVYSVTCAQVTDAIPIIATISKLPGAPSYFSKGLSRVTSLGTSFVTQGTMQGYTAISKDVSIYGQALGTVQGNFGTMQSLVVTVQGH